MSDWSDSDASDIEFNDELCSALSADFNTARLAPNAPNPGITIEGIGLVPLPLPETYAKAIGARAQAVETSTAVWDIEGKDVSFANPAWEGVMDLVASRTVWNALNIAPYTSKPRWELNKLTICEPGSRIFPEQETAMADGTFATIVAVLPSTFDGGQVHVSHAERTEILDVSKSSTFATSFLAWYTGVTSEVKPIVSGYRLSLSYSLIYTSPETPVPSIVGLNSASDGLRRAMQKWKNGEYDRLPRVPLVAYLLSRKYKKKQLIQGAKALLGPDAHLAKQLLPISRELSFTVKTRGGGGDEIYDQGLDLSNLVRITDGEPLGLSKISIEDDSLLPRNAFKGVAPDDENCDGSENDYGVTQWYDRSVLVLFRNEDETSIILHAKGPVRALKALKPSDTPTASANEIIAAVFDLLENPDKKDKHECLFWGSEVKPTSCAMSLLSHAVAWKSHDLWNRAVAHLLAAPNATKDAIDCALSAFDLDKIKPGLVAAIKLSAGLQTKIDIVAKITSHLGECADDWVKELNELLSKDVPVLVKIAADVGPSSFAASTLPIISNTATYDFTFALAKALEDNNQGEIAEETNQALVTLVRQCLLNLTGFVGFCMSINEIDVCITFTHFKDDSAIPSWAQTLMGEALLSVTAGEPLDVPKLLWIIQYKGIKCLHESVLKQPGSYEFWIAFAKALIEEKEKLSRTPARPVESIADYAAVITKCLARGAPMWRGQYCFNARNAQVNRIINHIDVCITSGELSPCVVLFNSVLEIPAPTSSIPDVATWFRDLQIPLIQYVKALLRKRGKSISLEPFRSYFEIIISLYLARVLGCTPLTAFPTLPAHMVGCGRCQDCKKLDVFARDNTRELRFQAKANVRKHLEDEIYCANIDRLVATETDGSGKPHTLVVRKSRVVQAALNWVAAKAQAIQFVGLVGDDEEVKRLMPERYGDVTEALQGTKTFIVASTTIDTSASTSLQTLAASAPVAGTKRKDRD
ncbi:hypothetical protein DFP72DRAFT_893947 [Ephemerocybe angulata]|uniref:Uncharacterized protein n=1 Tax=Ephemerocybe angulata TaxID=980116 RepID=A0A8H6I0A4_9AGAR|nr:hypothetical protein DFP72DRAFT_893947 [Tulosesus angulatus]